MNKMVVLVRGPSGSGKTTFAEGLRVQANKDGLDFVRISADDFFERDVFDGTLKGTRKEYVFEVEKLSEAHQVCLGRYIDALVMGRDGSMVVVDNTFCKLWEMDNYVRLAKVFGWELKVVEMAVDTVREVLLCSERNRHGVPFEVVVRQVYNFEPWPGADRVRIGV